jgi:hypothetical protein
MFEACATRQTYRDCTNTHRTPLTTTTHTTQPFPTLLIWWPCLPFVPTPCTDMPASFDGPHGAPLCLRFSEEAPAETPAAEAEPAAAEEVPAADTAAGVLGGGLQ